MVRGWNTAQTRERNSTNRPRSAERFARLRESAELTQEELAHRMRVSFQYISQVENGHRGVRWATVERFLDGMNASLHDLANELEADTTVQSERLA
jgi:transcriptional regulator with XRE-family HTH domain